MKVSLTHKEARELRRIADHLRVRPREALRRIIIVVSAALRGKDEEARHRALPEGEAAGPPEHQSPLGGETDASTQ